MASLSVSVVPFAMLVRPSQVLARPRAVHAAPGPFAVTERVKVVATSGKQATSPVARRATTWYPNEVRRRSGTRNMTSAELTEIRELFRAKLRQLRDEERPRAATTKRRPTRSRYRRASRPSHHRPAMATCSRPAT